MSARPAPCQGCGAATRRREISLDVLIDLSNAFPMAMAQLDHAADSALQEHVRHAIRLATIDQHAGSSENPDYR
jgi:hypothetical protein